MPSAPLGLRLTARRQGGQGFVPQAAALGQQRGDVLTMLGCDFEGPASRTQSIASEHPRHGDEGVRLPADLGIAAPLSGKRVCECDGKAVDEAIQLVVSDRFAEFVEGAPVDEGQGGHRAGPFR